MRLPRALAYFNRKVTNRLFSPLARRVPPFAIVEHVGRRTFTTVLERERLHSRGKGCA
jgi:hypothetical protein